MCISRNQMTKMVESPFLIGFSNGHNVHIRELVREMMKIQKKIFIKKKSPTTVQICRLKNIEHKSMKQVSYSGK